MNAVHLSGGHPLIWRNLATCLWDIDRPTAVATLQAILNVDPGDDDALRRLEAHYVITGAHETAAALHHQTLSRHPDPTVRSAAALDALVAADRIEEAMALMGVEPATNVGAAAVRPIRPDGSPVLLVANHPDFGIDADHFAQLIGREVRLHAGDPGAIGFIPGLIVMISHTGPGDAAMLHRFRDLFPATPSAVWLIDNHHGFNGNAAIVQAADFVGFAHRYCADFIRRLRPSTQLWLPPSVAQWRWSELSDLVAASAFAPRDDRLNGCFGYYPNALRRNRVAAGLAARFCDHAVSLVVNVAGYFQKDGLGRFDDWARWKTGLILPSQRDIPYRLFDALAAGAVPLAPRWIDDLDLIFDAATQAALPIVRFDREDPDDIMRAHRMAVAAFDAGGPDGMRRRQQFVLDGHLMAHRLRDLYQFCIAAGQNA